MNKKRTLIMLACCLVPIAALGLFALFNIPLNKLYLGAMILICPLSHLLMMKFMGHEHNEHQHTQARNTTKGTSQTSLEKE